MSASRLKVVSPLHESDPASRSSSGLPLGRHDSAPFQILSEAVHSFEVLSERCAAAEARNEHESVVHAQEIDEARSTIEHQRQRIAYLESLLQDFKQGLQQLAHDAAQQTEDLKRSDQMRAELSSALTAKTADAEALQRRCFIQEKEVEAARHQQRLTMETVTRHVDQLRTHEQQSAAEVLAVKQAREDIERLLDESPRSIRRPGPVERNM